MSKRQIIECDRCGAIDSDGDQDRQSWGRAYAATLSGRDIVGSEQSPADLCGDCLVALDAFVAGKQEPTE